MEMDEFAYCNNSYFFQQHMMIIYSLSASKTKSSSSVIAPISIALSRALKPPASLIEARAPLNTAQASMLHNVKGKTGSGEFKLQK